MSLIPAANAASEVYGRERLVAGANRSDYQNWRFCLQFPVGVLSPGSIENSPIQKSAPSVYPTATNVSDCVGGSSEKMTVAENTTTLYPCHEYMQQSSHVSAGGESKQLMEHCADAKSNAQISADAYQLNSHFVNSVADACDLGGNEPWVSASRPTALWYKNDAKTLHEKANEQNESYVLPNSSLCQLNDCRYPAWNEKTKQNFGELTGSISFHSNWPHFDVNRCPSNNNAVNISLSMRAVTERAEYLPCYTQDWYNWQPSSALPLNAANNNYNDAEMRMRNAQQHYDLGAQTVHDKTDCNAPSAALSAQISKSDGSNQPVGDIVQVTTAAQAHSQPTSWQTVNSGAQQQTNMCPICRKMYARPSTLKTHMRTHYGDRPFKCVVCSKAFSQAANLTAHYRIHSGDKPFKCHICSRSFSQSSSVTTHLRTHSGERPYNCTLCKKTFSDNSTLTKHLRVHTGERPYICSICSLRFSQSGNLNRHRKIHMKHS